MPISDQHQFHAPRQRLIPENVFEPTYWGRCEIGAANFKDLLFAGFIFKLLLFFNSKHDKTSESPLISNSILHSSLDRRFFTRKTEKVKHKTNPELVSIQRNRVYFLLGDWICMLIATLLRFRLSDYCFVLLSCGAFKSFVHRFFLQSSRICST